MRAFYIMTLTTFLMACTNQRNKITKHQITINKERNELLQYKVKRGNDIMAYAKDTVELYRVRDSIIAVDKQLQAEYDSLEVVKSRL